MARTRPAADAIAEEICTAIVGDLGSAAKAIEKATDKLGDVVLILDSRGSSGGDYEADEALSDVHREVAQTVDLIGRLSEMPDKLRRLR